MTQTIATTQTTLDWLKQTAIHALGVRKELLNDHATLTELGVDSLAQLKIIVLAEKELAASIPDEAFTSDNLRSLETLAQTIDLFRE